MKTLKIDQVTIKQTSKGLEYHLPIDMTGVKFTKFKKTHAKQIADFFKESEIRKIYEIASEIRRDWKKPYFGAVPYLQAMQQLNEVTDNYYFASGESIVRYFLANASTWKGETARRIKAELKTMLKK